MVFFDFGVGKSNCTILSLIICVLTRKWYHSKADILNCDIKEENYKSMLYSRRYGLKSRAGQKNISRFCFLQNKVYCYINKK